MSIDIEVLGGSCPVQAEGTIDGKRFYFRARGNRWSLAVHPTCDGDFLSWPDGWWEHWENWGDDPYAAGWMPEDVAREKIGYGAELYRASALQSAKAKGE